MPVLALDVDGVLLDPERAGKGRWQEALREEFGVEPALMDSVFFQRSWPEVIVGRESVESALADALVELGWNIGVEALLQVWFEADFEIDDVVVRAVNDWAASGVRVVLVTNQEARRARFIEQGLHGILPVQGMAFSGALGVVKSDPAFYPLAEQRLDIEGHGQDVVFVDDSYENIDAAETHGWRGVLFNKRFDWRSQIASALALRMP
jgi:FMN phosphatase YigB (HAD superfamily)